MTTEVHLMMVKLNQSRVRFWRFWMIFRSPSLEMELLSANRVYYSQVFLLLGLPVYGSDTWCRNNSPPPACWAGSLVEPEP